ncbi:T9SS type B sorting domain-containing protein [Winogradskyella tangerina]|uniref:T9SS type B sorting domain-containing protein n=1 Tax=Winogradskyella tangerina TaxID=2023240 RepID=UPI000DBE7F24|nr:T9SS type B sorting domain-containing protein [Winogradskyella tangerina]
MSTMDSVFPQKYRIVFCFVLLSQLAFAQLDDFNLSLSVIDESCAGNGSISMSVSGTTNGATITYNLFLLPETATPIAQTTTSSFNNLESGEYRVEAIQTLGDQQNSESADATINNVFSVLDFEISQGLSDECNGSNLIVSTLSGNSQFFEIISGPVIVPLQEDNIFNNLPDGTYVIRVFDECGNALTKTYTLISNQQPFSISGIQQAEIVETCDNTEISFSIIADNGTILSYPITITYNSSSLDGEETVSFTAVFDNGSQNEIEIIESLPNLNDSTFALEIVVEDNCGNTVIVTDFITTNPEVTLIDVPSECGKNLIIDVANFLPPYTIEFVEAPADFDPSDYNDNNGVYTESTIFFEQDIGLPYGVYTVLLVDACDKSDTATIELVEEPIEPMITTSNGGCDPLTGELTFSVPDRDLVSAVFTDAPEEYENELPDDISNFILSGNVLVVSDLVIGTYIVEVVDNCGDVYIEEIVIPDLEDLPLNVTTSPNCTSETGSLRIAGSYGIIESVVIIDAPATFASTLPFDYSDAITDSGFFYVENLPIGNYSVEFTDSCGNLFAVNQDILGYTSNPSIYNLQRNCGSFDLSIFDTDNSVTNISYWFQKYYSESDSWGHPETGVLYSEGQLPTNSNSIPIQNGETILNNFFTGTFRLIKTFQSLNNPGSDDYCFDFFAEFDVGSDLIINDVFSLNCEGGSGPSDIIVDVLGVPPYNFSIISPVVIDNGEDNIFTGLDPGVYEIRVEDVCGSIEAITINLQDLPPVVDIGTPSDLVICSDEGTNQVLFDLSQQNEQLLGNQDPERFTITYHLSQLDADSGNNPIPESYENIINPQTIFTRIVNNSLDVCYETASFQLVVGLTPDLGSDEFLIICEDDSFLLSADSGYSSYLWSTGETTRDIIVDSAGVYTVTVSNDYDDFLCSATKTYNVDVSGAAIINAITTEDFTANNNAINIDVSGLGDYEYSLDGLVYQQESLFTNLDSGDYTVFIRDKNGCGVVTQTLSLLDYKRFFTPNGDGENDYWQICGSKLEPNLLVYVFDRYGKLLNVFNGDQKGWDGTYNGRRMPTSDYWFLVERQNGKSHTGHFTLKR